MTAATDFEDRLRRGLHAAADALPPPPADADARLPHERPPRRSRGPLHPRWAPGALAAAAAVVAVVATVAVVNRDRPDPSDVEAGQQPPPSRPAESPTADLPVIDAAANGAVPGRAVMTGNQLHTFGPDGVPTGTAELSGIESVQAASSDLDGGWVACGYGPADRVAVDDLEVRVEEAQEQASQAEGAELTGEAVSPESDRVGQLDVTMVPAPDGGSPPTSTAPTGGGEPTSTVPAWDTETAYQVPPGDAWLPSKPVMWYPAGGEPVELDIRALCIANSIHVIDAPEGPTLVYGGSDLRAHALVLATGEDRVLNLPPLDLATYGSVDASPGRVIAHGEANGFQLFDLATGETLPLPELDLGVEARMISDIAVAPDATSLAVLVGPVEGPIALVVVDLTTGAERYYAPFPELAMEGDQLSYDGTTVAVGSFAEAPVTVIDLTTGARHTLDAYGVVL